MRGDLLHGGQPFSDQVFGSEIFLEDLLQPVEDPVVGNFPGQELAMIEPFGIVEQGIEMGNDDVLAELVDIVLVLLVDGPDDARNGKFFFPGEEQGLIYGIVKIFALPDGFGQRGIP